jgi:hypothetical protein
MSVSKGWHGSLSLMSVCFVVAQVFVEYAKLDAFNALRLKLRDGETGTVLIEQDTSGLADRQRSLQAERATLAQFLATSKNASTEVRTQATTTIAGLIREAMNQPDASPPAAMSPVTGTQLQPFVSPPPSACIQRTCHRVSV